jgi:DNA repair protein RadC
MHTNRSATVAQPMFTVIRDHPATYAECPQCHARLDLDTAGTKWTVRSPRDVADRLMLSMGALEREEMRVLLLSTKNVVRGETTVYQGNVSAALVRMAELFRDAVQTHAAGIILVHNHPSGEPEPSADDLYLTAEAIAAGRLLDVPVLDHIIVARDSYISLRDRGVNFDRR